MLADYDTAHVDRLRVNIQRDADGSWFTAHEGAVTDGGWTEIAFATQVLSAVEFTYYYLNKDVGMRLYEAQVYEKSIITEIPVCLTDLPSAVQEDGALFHGFVSNDGGELCEYRFQYGTSETNLFASPWISGCLAGEEFSYGVTGLSAGVVYIFRAQLRNSAGVASGDFNRFVTRLRSQGWTTPEHAMDPDGAWQNEFYAIDNLEETSAFSTHHKSEPEWGSWLYLSNNNAMPCDAIRFISSAGAETERAMIDVDLDGIWSTVFSDAIANLEVTEVAFPTGIVSQARIRFKARKRNSVTDWRVHEFDFHFLRDTNRVLTPLEEWELSVFSLDQLHDYAVSGLYGDPDDDGVVNLQEYAFGTDPLTRDHPVRLEILACSEMDSHLKFVRRKTAADIQYNLMVKIESDAWKNVNDWIHSSTIEENSDGVTETVQLCVGHPPAAKQSFLMFKIAAVYAR